MQQPEHDQPCTAAVEDGRKRHVTCFGTIHHHHHTRPVEHGEDSHEFLVEKQVREEPRAHVQRVRAAHDQRVVISRQRHRERVDVHHEDAHYSNTAQGVQGNEPLGRRDGACVLPGERFRITHQMLLLYLCFPVNFFLEFLVIRDILSLGKLLKGGDPCLVRLQGYRENRWVLAGLWSNLPQSSDPWLFRYCTHGRPPTGRPFFLHNGQAADRASAACRT